MTQLLNSKRYDLEDRTLKFSEEVLFFVRDLKKNMLIYELSKQLVRSACSVGANYIEANEALSKKDFIMRIKICRKEAKETQYWIKLIQSVTSQPQNKLLNESIELMKIFGAILQKV